MNKINTSTRKFANYPWIGISGAILIFLSWFFQNNFTNSQNDEKLRLIRSQTTIDLQQIRFENWHLAYLKEKSNKTPDTSLLLITVFKTLQSYQNLVAWSSARVNNTAEGSSEIINLKQLTQKALTDNLIRGDLSTLELDLAKCIQTENKTGFSDLMTDKFKEKYAETNKKLNTFTFIFLLFYILGSVLIGFDYMRKLNKSDLGK